MTFQIHIYYTSSSYKMMHRTYIMNVSAAPPTNGALLRAAPSSVSRFISCLCVTSVFQRPILASLPSDEPAALPGYPLLEAGEKDGGAGSVPESHNICHGVSAVLHSESTQALHLILIVIGIKIIILFDSGSYFSQFSVIYVDFLVYLS